MISTIKLPGSKCWSLSVATIASYHSQHHSKFTHPTVVYTSKKLTTRQETVPSYANKYMTMHEAIRKSTISKLFEWFQNPLQQYCTVCTYIVVRKCYANWCNLYIRALLTNCRLRLHLGLRITDGVSLRVADRMMGWEEGKVLIFDDSYEHEVWHNGTETRLILIVDVWHPDIPKSRRSLLTPI